MKILLITIISCCFCIPLQGLADTELLSDKSIHLAKWYGNKKAAVSLRFDDSTEGHVKTAVPTLNEFGIKATFMINPGRRSYNRHKDFWEKELPQMDHRLGNHTWRHKGARNMEEAEREIRSVSELIWKLYPAHSKLTVFASGGGEKWGGKYWENADAKYKQLVSKYHMIDLYDGHHRTRSVRFEDTVENLCALIEKAISSNSHRPITFHRIGNHNAIDYLRKIFGKTIYSYKATKFKKFINRLKQMEDDLWIDHLVQIYKYESEFQNANLILDVRDNNITRLTLEINTDSLLYNHPLTLVIPNNGMKVKVYQASNGQKHHIPVQTASESFLADLKPVNSQIELIYSNH